MLEFSIGDQRLRYIQRSSLVEIYCENLSKLLFYVMCRAYLGYTRLCRPVYTRNDSHTKLGLKLTLNN